MITSLSRSPTDIDSSWHVFLSSFLRTCWDSSSSSMNVKEFFIVV
nr:MAG TPA_asm: hypothetical protein [Caudoviricetes sp.]